MRRNLKQSGFMAGFTESYLADLGRVVAAWAHVESQFDMLFLSFVVMRNASSGSMKDPRVKFLGEAFERRMRRFRERMAEMDLRDPEWKKTDRILCQLTQLRSERDEIAHGVFHPSFHPETGFKPDEAVATLKSWRNEKPYQDKTFSQKRLKQTFEKIHALHWDLVDLSLHLPRFSPKRLPALR